ncbi:MAG: hypothetical protein Q8P67_07555, partial [archaeon]|nr:hypothetical protein [archaeon]
HPPLVSRTQSITSFPPASRAVTTELRSSNSSAPAPTAAPSFTDGNLAETLRKRRSELRPAPENAPPKNLMARGSQDHIALALQRKFSKVNSRIPATPACGAVADEDEDEWAQSSPKNKSSRPISVLSPLPLSR